MKRLLLALLLTGVAWAHSIDYQVDSVKSLCVTLRFSDEDLCSYSEFEVFSPADAKIPFETGRTDRLGRVVFAPDQPGKWTVKVKADSQHGIHGQVVEVDVGNDAVVVNFSKPLVAVHTKLLVGVGLLLGGFAVVQTLLRRKKQ